MNSDDEKFEDLPEGELEEEESEEEADDSPD